MKQDNKSSNVEQLFGSLKEIRSICPICNITRREIKLKDISINQRTVLKEKFGLLELKGNPLILYCRTCNDHSILV